jgi:hypothetical protein
MIQIGALRSRLEKQPTDSRQNICYFGDRTLADIAGITLHPAQAVALGSKAPQELFNQLVTDGTTAILIILAMSFGLIFPKMCIGGLQKRRMRALYLLPRTTR